MLISYKLLLRLLSLNMSPFFVLAKNNIKKKTFKKYPKSYFAKFWKTKSNNRK